MLGSLPWMWPGSAVADPVEKVTPAPAAQGVQVEAAYFGDIVRNLDPGIVAADRKTVYQGLLDLGFTVHTGDAGWWRGGTFHVHAINTHGGQPSASHIGDVQFASNIEAAPHTLLYEAWYEQAFADGEVSLRAGLYDLNSEFYVSDYASLFLNSSFGVGGEISANVPASIFPRPGLGIRLRIQANQQVYIAAASCDGDPATRKLSKAEGRMDIAEAGFRYAVDASRPGMFKVGVWQHTALQPQPFGSRLFSRDYGSYAQLEQRLTNWEGGRFGAFLRYGIVPGDRNAVSSDLAAGLNLAGIMTGRPDDTLGLAMTRVDNLYAPGRRGFETTWELTYRLAVGKYLSLQPDYQWIHHPQGNPANHDIRVLLGRLILEL